MELSPAGPLWAVHVADGVLGWPWLLGGFAVAGVLALAASWRVREEEVPRIALLTAAFFVASSIHVKFGPTSVHLLLNGLVGVVLGWRAPLAVLVGVTLQALLIPHGGLTTIGINAATEALPALAAAALFPLLRAATCGRPVPRGLLVAASAFVWGGCLVFAAAALLTNPWRDLVRFSPEAGVVVSLEQLGPAVGIVVHPATLALLAAGAVACAWLERRLENAPEFPAGACVGAFAVVGTTLLTGLVLLADGADRWGTFASAVFLAHLPLALLEGLILGVTVGFLARVKPEMLGSTVGRAASLPRETTPLSSFPSPLIVLALGTWLVTASPALAHRLEAEPKVDRQKKQVTIESWYETGDAPKEAKAKVLRGDGSILAEGALDEKGVFVFTYDNTEPLRVEITAPGGHRASLRLTARDLGAEDETDVKATNEGPRSRGRDLLLGLTFLLALASFVLSWRNASRLAELKRG